LIKVVLRKIGYALLTLFGVTTVIFFLFSVLPGDPAQMMLGDNQSEKQILQIQKKYGFDKPISIQYLYYLNDLAPISFHKNNDSHYTSLISGKYTSATLFSFSDFDVALKLPYLRESFQQNGLSVASIISKTLPNTAI
jgi:peptide/nickel transport system permease protein